MRNDKLQIILQTAHLNVILSLGVEVGLKTTYQIVRENESPALVCAVVDSPDEDNPSSVSFPFDIHFHFNGARDSASREYTM